MSFITKRPKPTQEKNTKSTKLQLTQINNFFLDSVYLRAFRTLKMANFKPKLMQIDWISKKSYLGCYKLSFGIPISYEWLHQVTTDAN